MNNKEIIEKWYKQLFSSDFEGEFLALLDKNKEYENYTAESAVLSDNIDEADGNLLKCLFLCEYLEQEYEKRGIARTVLLDTLSDIVIWAKIHRNMTGKFGISEVNWIKRHFALEIFRIGRLEYCFAGCRFNIDELCVKVGDCILEMHIPGAEPLIVSDCLASLDMAREFFEKHFPDTDWKCFTCYSWLLDDTLENLMNKDANIIKFQHLFKLLCKTEKYDILKFTVDKRATKDNLSSFKPINAFTERVFGHINGGGKLYTGFGYIKK